VTALERLKWLEKNPDVCEVIVSVEEAKELLVLIEAADAE
jgi:hypothetical protein